MTNPLDEQRAAYKAGWIECAKWAKRDDLIADIGSPAYDADRDAALTAPPLCAKGEALAPTPMIDYGDFRGSVPAYRLGAYYYNFRPTGIDAIDLILSAVACAGKAFHHTESWQDECEPYNDRLRGGSPQDWIQNAAYDAAEALRTTPAQPRREVTADALDRAATAYCAELKIAGPDDWHMRGIRAALESFANGGDGNG